MSSTGLILFHQLCDVGNALVLLRDRHEPGSDDWCTLMCLLLTLDASIDMLVRSGGTSFAADGREGD